MELWSLLEQEMNSSTSSWNISTNYEQLRFDELNFIEADVFISLEAFIAVFSFSNNLLVLMALWKFPALRSPTNCFVASLAVADIAVAVFAIPSAIVLRLGLSVHHDECDFVDGPSVGEATCLVLIVSVLVLTQVSIYSLLLIAIDRFIAIHYPYRYSSFSTASKTRLAIISAWVLSVLVIVPPLLSWSQWTKISSPCEKNKCAFEVIVNKEYMVYVNFFGCVLLPLIAMCVMYSVIFRSAKKQLVKIYSYVKDDEKEKKVKQRKMKNFSQTAEINPKTPPRGKDNTNHRDCDRSCSLCEGSDSPKLVNSHKQRNSNHDMASGDKLVAENKSPQCTSTYKFGKLSSHCLSNDEFHHRAKIRRKRALLRRELHAAKILATVVGVFALCWLPLHLLHTVTLWCTGCEEPYMILDITILLSHANSLVNPVIYAHRLRDFRHAFRKIFAPFSRRISSKGCFTNCIRSKLCVSLHDASPGGTTEHTGKRTA